MNESVWRAFVASDTTLGPDAGVREAWHRGRERYAVWVVRVRDERAVDRMRRVADAVAPFVRAEPAKRAHVTVFVCGFPAAVCTLDDDVSEALLDEQTAALAGAGEVELVLGGASCFRTCAFVEVRDPAGALGRWRRALAATYPPGHRGEIRFAPYVPHLTVGSFHGAHPVGAVADALAPLRALEPLAVRCGPPVLVEYDARVPDAPLRHRRVV